MCNNDLNFTCSDKNLIFKRIINTVFPQLKWKDEVKITISLQMWNMPGSVLERFNLVSECRIKLCKLSRRLSAGDSFYRIKNMCSKWIFERNPKRHEPSSRVKKLRSDYSIKLSMSQEEIDLLNSANSCNGKLDLGFQFLWTLAAGETQSRRNKDKKLKDSETWNQFDLSCRKWLALDAKNYCSNETQ